MIKWFDKIFCSKRITALENEIDTLKNKVLEKQEQINKTNAYYKRVIRDIKSKPKK
jgi:peptidoglycan hydrolase CwlO-like protein